MQNVTRHPELDSGSQCYSITTKRFRIKTPTE